MNLLIELVTGDTIYFKSKFETMNDFIEQIIDAHEARREKMNDIANGNY